MAVGGVRRAEVPLLSDLLLAATRCHPGVYDGGESIEFVSTIFRAVSKFGANLLVVRLLESSRGAGRFAEVRSGEPEFGRKSRRKSR